jgi:ATP-dependent RNA helicase DDX35
MAVFWKPGTIAPGSSIDRETERESEETLLNVYRDISSRLTIQQQRERLPIYKHKHEILYLLDNYQVLILVGHTGSGNNTKTILFR